ANRDKLQSDELQNSIQNELHTNIQDELQTNYIITEVDWNKRLTE
ncbi:28631_t:CDS:1, partial [Gigaspora margarita]